MASWEIEVILWKSGRRVYEGHAGPISADRIGDNADVLVFHATERAYAEGED